MKKEILPEASFLQSTLTLFIAQHWHVHLIMDNDYQFCSHVVEDEQWWSDLLENRLIVAFLSKSIFPPPTHPTALPAEVLHIYFISLCGWLLRARNVQRCRKWSTICTRSILPGRRQADRLERYVGSFGSRLSLKWENMINSSLICMIFLEITSNAHHPVLSSRCRCTDYPSGSQDESWKF